MKSKQITTEDKFNNKWGFVISCIGSSVGMANIWLFPYRAGEFGGAAFLIPYIIFVVLIGFTGVIGEMAFGRAMQSGPLGAFKKAYEMKGSKLGTFIGLIPVIGSLGIAIGYSVIIGWILKFFADSITGKIISEEDPSAIFGELSRDFGSIPWHLLGLFLVLLCMSFGVARGIEKVNRIMMPAFFVLFLFLAVRVAFLDGSAPGYSYLFKPDWSEMANPRTWVYAMGQAFFSLSVAGNGTLIYGSYLSDEENIPASAARVALFDTIAAILAALVIIPAMATTGAKLDQGGPGLLFIYLPNLIRSMPGGTLIAIIFFVAVLFAGMTSLLNLYEAPIATVQEKLHLGRVPACAVIGIIGAAVSLLIQGIVSDWMDVLSIYICPLGAGLAGIMFFWVFGKDYAETQVNKGREKKFSKWFVPVCRYIYIPVCVLVLILGIALGGIG